MKQVLELKQNLHVARSTPLGGTLSLGEFFSLMEKQIKSQFVDKMVEHISFGKSYVFRITCIDIEYLDFCVKETFKFEMYEMEPGDNVVTDNTTRKLWES